VSVVASSSGSNISLTFAQNIADGGIAKYDLRRVSVFAVAVEKGCTARFEL
jgi:hypothetical protein